MEFSFDVYFSETGWVKGLENYSVAYFPKENIEAVKIPDNDSFDCKIKNDIGLLKSDSNEIIGKGIPANQIFFSSIKNTDYKIFYRVCINGCWTAFMESDGDKIVSNDYLNGIQIVAEKELTEKELLKAEDKIKKYNLLYQRLFLNHKENALVHLNNNYIDDRPKGVKEIKNGIILPLRETEDSPKKHVTYYSGGVTDSDYNFVSGFERLREEKMNFCCVESYVPDSIVKSDNTVIFGGILLAHFGHILAESVSRLWWIIDNSSDNEQIVFLCQEEKGEEKKETSLRIIKNIFKILEIDEDRLIILDKATQFAKVIVPDQLIRLHSDFRKSYVDLYKKMADKCTYKEGYKKVYLTRTHLSNNSIINEEYFERFFEKRGYVIVAPEEYEFSEQISILKSADEVICSEGTLSHLTVFCKPDAVLTFFRREDNTLLTPQTLIDVASNHIPYYVDVTYNLLPVRHNIGVFLFGPTSKFVGYLNERNIEYTQDEIAFDIQDYIGEYIIEWVKKFREPNAFSNISNNDIFDVLYSLNKSLGYDEIVPRDFMTPARRNKRKIKKLEEKIRVLEVESNKK